MLLPTQTVFVFFSRVGGGCCFAGKLEIIPRQQQQQTRFLAEQIALVLTIYFRARGPQYSFDSFLVRFGAGCKET